MDEPARLAVVWPIFGLVVRTPRLELRYPTDLELVELGELTGDIHDADVMPFTTPWTRVPDGEREQDALRHHWETRSRPRPSAWRLGLAAFVDGEAVGMQSIGAGDYAARRTVDTGSWLHRLRQGKGLGREMRSAVLHLAFAGLGAERAETSAYEGSVASQRVTASLGYRPNSVALEAFDGGTRRCFHYVLDRADWLARRREDVELVGLGPCLELLGAAHAVDRPAQG